MGERHRRWKREGCGPSGVAERERERERERENARQRLWCE